MTQKPDEVDVDALFVKHQSEHFSDYGWMMNEASFKEAITEALRGSYTREEMIAFAKETMIFNYFSKDAVDVTIKSKLDQFDERSKG